MSLVFDLHRAFLSDEPRVESLKAAIRQTVRPGDVVADIGAGTGVLALLACKAGAARVYAIEREPIIELARRIAHVNGCDGRIQFIKGNCLDVVLPEQVDVVISDLIGYFAFEAGIFEVLSDAYQRYLKPGGRTIPAEITLHVAAVEHAEFRSNLLFWRERPGGFDMTPAYDRVRKSTHSLWLSPDALISEPVRAGHFPMRVPVAPSIRAEATVRAVRDGIVDAVGGWFDAALAPGIHITNDPRNPRRLNRRMLMLPVTDPFSVRAGDQLALSVRVLPADRVIRWSVSHQDAHGRSRSFSTSNFEALLMSRGDIERLAATARPTLSADGQAVRRLLDLADQGYSRQDIEAAVFAEFPDRFPVRGRAAEFVSETLLRYTR